MAGIDKHSTNYHGASIGSSSQVGWTQLSIMLQAKPLVNAGYAIDVGGSTYLHASRTTEPPL
jgi:hypothetical protein